MSDMKDYRKKEIPFLILGNLLVLMYFNKVFDVSIYADNKAEWISLIIAMLDSTILSSIIYIFTILLDGVFNDKVKYFFVYFGFGGLPGETIFTKIKKKNPDKRFSYQQVFKAFPEIYDNLPFCKRERKKYENHEWNKLLGNNRENSMVYNSEKDSLMFRDMYCINILFFVIYIVISLIFKMMDFNIKYMFFLLSITIVLNISTRNKIKRFAYNVIVAELNRKGEII